MNWITSIPGGTSSMAIMPFALSDQEFNSTTTLLTAASSCYNDGIRFYSCGVRDVSGNAQVFKYDTDMYLEFEVDVPNKILRFWIDAAGGMMVSNMYVIDATDDIAPTTHLGSMTRIMGEAPDTDVYTDFIRSTNFSANHSLLDSVIDTQTVPRDFLAGDGVNIDDRYKSTHSQASSYAAKVHAVNVQARYTNMAIESHEMARVLQNAVGDRNEVSFGTLSAGSGFKMPSTVQDQDPSGHSWTPETAANVEYGCKVK